MDLDRAHTVKNGISLSGKLNIFEGSDLPENALADAGIGSIYIKYGGTGEVGTYQKTGHNPLTFINLNASGGGDIDGGDANTTYSTDDILDGGGA